jgi:UDPglucose 6-dehydrogenase
VSEREPIGVIGTGWVGLVTAACFAELGHRVVARDVVAEKVAALDRGEVPIHEPGLPELIERNRERLQFTTEIEPVLEAARLIFICVQTPPTHSGDADLTAVMRAVEEIGSGGQRALVMKSTVPVGTGRRISAAAKGLAYVSCPEFLREGTAVKDFLEPDRVVIGAQPGDEWAADAVAAAYEPVGAPIVRTDLSSAEMIKLASNAFLATKISFINEIANVSEEVGADVTEVARGMGLDDRIGPRFLQAGIGYGGSCFSGSETLLVRDRGWPNLLTFEELWERLGGDSAAEDGQAIQPDDLKVWSWVPGEDEPEWMPVSVVTKRHYDGEMIEVRTKMGRRIRVTADHPFVVGDGSDDAVLTRMLAADLTEADWLPLALGAPPGYDPGLYSMVGAVEDRAVDPMDVVVRPERRELRALASRSSDDLTEVFRRTRQQPPGPAELRRMQTLRLEEACNAGLDLRGATLGTSRSGNFVPSTLSLDESFWRVAGLYLAEGCVVRASRRDDCPGRGLIWSFHPSAEEHLVEEVVEYWKGQGVRTSVTDAATSRRVVVTSRLIAAWWVATLGFGRNGYEQRIPDLAWEQGEQRKRALLSGLWEGDGYLSFINHGRSPILEFGTVSDELAEGVVRLLGDLGIVCAWYRGRTRLSTKETHWLTVSGGEQVERASFLADAKSRPLIREALMRQQRRMSSAGYRRFDDGIAWVRVTETRRDQATESVFSLKVPGSQTVVASNGLVVSQCFPKDVSALKILAGNSGYHFQLLNSVIEVNDLQKRRVLSKLTKHLDSLSGKRVALLGLAFKADTDDMREASSLVLASRLQGEGATVVAYDPVAEDRAKELLSGVEMSKSPLEAIEGADAAVLVTEWPEFAELDWAEVARRMSTPLLVDGRNFLDAEAVRAAGLTYEGVGRPSASEPQT